MHFNNGKERADFEKNWEQLRKWYRAEGMSEDAIEAMYRFDLEEFNSKRRFLTHNIYLEDVPEKECSEEDYESFEKNKSRFWWLEEISDPDLAAAIKELSDQDLQIYTMAAFEGYTQKEIGKCFGITQYAVSKRLRKIRGTANKLCKKEKNK